MAVSSEDIKLKVVIDSEGADLSGITRAGEELSAVGKSGESAIDRISAAVNNLNSKGASIASAGDGLKTVTSNASATESSLNSLGKQLAEVHSQFVNLKSGSEAFDALRAKSAELQAQIQQLKGTTTQIVSPSTITNTKALNSSLVDISRVISDMPYGMQGITNNLQQLPFSFGRLRAEADATGQSMTSMLVQGVMSPMGAGIAVAAVTAIWVAWDMYGAKVANAIGISGAAVANLDQQLEGIQKYKDFDLTVKIHGVDGLAKLKLELQQLLDQKAYLEGTLSRQADIKSAKPSIVSTVISSLSGYYAADPKAYTDAKLELKTYESIAAEKIKSAKITLGEKEDIRLMTTYYKMTTDEAKKQYAINQQNLSIEDKQSEIVKQIAKDKAKANKTSTTTESYTGWNSLVGAIESANTALGKNEVSTMSVETAQKSLKTELAIFSWTG